MNPADFPDSPQPLAPAFGWKAVGLAPSAMPFPSSPSRRERRRTILLLCLSTLAGAILPSAFSWTRPEPGLVAVVAFLFGELGFFHGWWKGCGRGLAMERSGRLDELRLTRLRRDEIALLAASNGASRLPLDLAAGLSGVLVATPWLFPEEPWLAASVVVGFVGFLFSDMLGRWAGCAVGLGVPDPARRVAAFVGIACDSGLWMLASIGAFVMTMVAFGQMRWFDGSTALAPVLAPLLVLLPIHWGIKALLARAYAERLIRVVLG